MEIGWAKKKKNGLGTNPQHFATLAYRGVSKNFKNSNTRREQQEVVDEKSCRSWAQYTTRQISSPAGGSHAGLYASGAEATYRFLGLLPWRQALILPPYAPLLLSVVCGLTSFFFVQAAETQQEQWG